MSLLGSVVRLLLSAASCSTRLLLSMARAAGVAGGPPAAVQRIPVAPGTFPLSFELGPRHAMMGGPFPEMLDVSARIDVDGDPLTKGPNDLEGRMSGVAAGSSELVLLLGPPSER